MQIETELQNTIPEIGEEGKHLRLSRPGKQRLNAYALQRQLCVNQINKLKSKWAAPVPT